MPRIPHRLRFVVIATALCTVGLAWADDDAALGLQADESAEKSADARPLRLGLEAGLGRVEQRLPSDRSDGRRLTLDLRWDARLNESWRFRLSNRLDHVQPDLGAGDTVNSLREVHVSWQPAGSQTVVEVGRINLRQGLGLAYSPTDFFRTGGLRTVTSADPVALRQQRLGTFMVRIGHTWEGGSAAVMLAPRLADAVNRAGAWSVDAGATNNNDRALLSVSLKASDTVSGQGSVLFERAASPRFGLNLSALVHDAVAVHVDLASGRMPPAVAAAQPQAATAERSRLQAALGATVSLPAAISLTAEAAYNGAGLDKQGWSNLFAQGPGLVQQYLALTQRDQEQPGRQAWMVHVSKTGLGAWKQLDLKGFVRTSMVDDSRLMWAEARYRWPTHDLAMQWQRSSGNAFSEYGATRYRQVLQVLVALYW